MRTLTRNELTIFSGIINDTFYSFKRLFLKDVWSRMLCFKDPVFQNFFLAESFTLFFMNYVILQIKNEKKNLRRRNISKDCQYTVWKQSKNHI